MPKRILILVFLIWLICDSLHGNDSIQESSFVGERAKRHVTYLSSDALEGRMSGTAGYRKAANWVAAKFKGWGLRPAGEKGTCFQEVTIPAFDWKTGVPSIRIGKRHFLHDDGDYRIHPVSTTGTQLKRDIVFAGYGIAAADKGLDEYAGIDARDRIVLVLKGSPNNAPPVRRFFEPPAEKETADEEWKEESTDWRKIRTAYDRGAAAILLYDPESETLSRDQGTDRSGAAALEPDRDFLCFTIDERLFRAIMKRNPQESPRGIKSRLDGLRRNIQQKKPESYATGVQAVLRGYEKIVHYDAAHGNNVARNVLAKIEGTDPKLKNEYILVGAHLDHIGIRDGYIYNGADDNASGSAVVLELARVFAETGFQPKRTLLFCCWCAEERGLIGSRHYTNHPCDGVVMDRVVAYFNLDMPGLGDNLQASGGLNFPSIWEVIVRDLDPEVQQRIRPSEGGPGGSDHSPFIERGIQSMMLIGGGGDGHPDLHQPEDDADKIDSNTLQLAGQFVLNGMRNLANETEVELRIPRRLDLYRGMRMRIRNFNPDLEGSSWTRVELEQASAESLENAVFERAREFFRSGTVAEDRTNRPDRRGGNRTGRPPLARGTADLAVVGNDTRLLKLAIDCYQIGRCDIEADDGLWIVDGRLTDAGRAAVKALEDADVTIRLVGPRVELIADILAASSKPFVMTGNYSLPEHLIDRLNDRNVLFGIDLDPEKVPEFIERVEQLKSQLKERKNLFAYLVSQQGLDDAKRPLYLGLIDRGWTHHEIVGTREHGGLIGGAGLAGTR